ESVQLQPDDPIFGLAIAFNKDDRAQKVNLGIGAYKNANGEPQVLSCVKSAENIIFNASLDKEYPPFLGDPDYINLTLELIYGKNSPVLIENSISAALTLGGTGALRLGGDF